MKYFSLESVANAYKGFQGAMTNKSWGYLAIMKQLQCIVTPGMTYSVNCTDLSSFLENTFCIDDERKIYNDDNVYWYVVFSNKCYDFFESQGNKKPNIYDVIVWAYRREPLPDNMTDVELIAKFAKEFNLSQDNLSNAFSLEKKNIHCNDSLYSEAELRSMLSSFGYNISEKNITAIGTSVKASPGELSRGPFIQPLYAALDTSDYLLISQSNFNDLYNFSNIKQDEIKTDKINKRFKELNRFADYVIKKLAEEDGLNSIKSKMNEKEQWIWFEDSVAKAGILRKDFLKGQTMAGSFSYEGYNVYVASGWDLDEKMTVPSFGVLQHIVSQYYGKRYKVIKSQDDQDKVEFSLIDLTDNSFVRLQDKRYITALRTKPFMLLAGISGTGKSRIVREFAYKSCPSYLQSDSTTPGNYCMIEVKPNWHDSSELLGYYSNITKKFMFTKFIKFLVKAQMHPTVPFFVCLDEMNLAPVEQYFAEFLSVLETRRHIDDGPNRIKTGVLVDKEYFKGHSDSEWYYAFNSYNNEKELTPEEEARQHQINKIVDAFSNTNNLATNGLSLPDNVFIIGTVNMDDTTHQFSRKVIDRAMTIEMNGGKLSQMFGHSSDLEYKKNDTECWTMDDKMNVRYVTADDVLKAHPSYANRIKDDLPKRLDAINQCLANTPFVVSYRVLNELTIYLGVLLDEAGSPDEEDYLKLVDKAIDQIMLMKILPRIEGEEESFNLSNDEKRITENNKITNKLEWLMSISPDVKYEDTSMTSSKIKIQEMLNRMQSGFTRFWP